MIDVATEKFFDFPTIQRTKTLYVVLHGLISLVDMGNKFKGHLLDMDNQHKYQFGNWLLEQDVPPRVIGNAPPKAVLNGVDSGTATLDPDKNAIIVATKPPDNLDPHVRAVIELPKPRGIFYFRLGNLTPTSLTGATVNGASVLQRVPAQLSQVRVFEYVFQDFTKLSFDFGGGTLWKPQSPAFVQDRAVVVLHIYDEPDKPLPEDLDHNDREFKLSTTFLNQPQLILKNLNTIALTDDDDALPLGLLADEILSLVERPGVLFRLPFEARVMQFGAVISTPPNSGLCVNAHAVLAS